MSSISKNLQSVYIDTISTLNTSGNNLQATNFTDTNLIAINVSLGNIIVSQTTIPNLVTNISTATLRSTNATIQSLITGGITSGNIRLDNNIIFIRLILEMDRKYQEILAVHLDMVQVIRTGLGVNGLITSANLSTVNITSTNLISTLVTTTNLIATNTSLGNLTSVTGTFANKVGTNQTVGTLNVTTGITTGTLLATSSLNATFNSNTLGNLFTTTGGNVGIGTTAPNFNLTIKAAPNNSSTEIGITNTAFTTANFKIRCTFCIICNYYKRNHWS